MKRRGSLSSDDLKVAARGRWREILVALGGVNHAILDGRGHACPRCGGSDRFAAFGDCNETGGLHCRHCGTDIGDGIKALQWLKDWDFPTALNALADHLGIRAQNGSSRGFVDGVSTEPPSSPGKEGVSSTSTRNVTPKKESYATPEEILSRLEGKMGKSADRWVYHDAEGNPIGWVCRWDLGKKKKIILPISRRADGSWAQEALAEPRPLYRRRELATADSPCVGEGEKVADILKALGFEATTSQGGSGAAKKSDWGPMAGKAVNLFPDRDAPGEKYAGSVIDELKTLSPRPTVRVIRLPGLGEKEDAVDFIARRREEGRTDEEIREEIKKLIESIEPESLDSELPLTTKFIPFPTQLFPTPISTYIREGAAALGCNEALIAVPLLSALASAIGNSARVLLKQSWSEPAIIWTCVVAPSGTLKSPALELALRPVRERQRQAMANLEQQMAEYERELLLYERDIAAWKKAKSDDLPPEKPVEPIADRFWLDDSTIEATAALLAQQPRGLVMVRDEMASWLLGFDKYTQGRGGDVARWLECFGGRPLLVDRKGTTTKTIYVAKANVSITGTTQPETLRKCLGQQHRENGLAARLLMTYPPRRAKRWSERDISPGLMEQVNEVFDRLYSLPLREGKHGELEPQIISLSTDAKSRWIEFFNEHAKEQISLDSDLCRTWAKLEGYAARLGLVIHLTRWASADETVGHFNELDSESIEAGIQLSRWFGFEAMRIHELLVETDAEADLRKLLEWISAQGGEVSARDVQRGYRPLKGAGRAEAALEDLARRGFGRWQDILPTAEGGRPTRVFRIVDEGVVDETPKTAGNDEGFVDTQQANDPETMVTGDDWMEI